ncbi:MAG: trypsin-like peptidase domain-containing protein [Pseudomonadota bacterium]
MKFIINCLLGVFLALTCPVSAQTAPPEQVFSLEDAKPAVVNIVVRYSKYFGSGQAGTFSGTGFIVNHEKGLAATNRHVAVEYPAQIQITFWDGTSVLGKVVYYDPTHDFSIVQYDPGQVKCPVKDLRLGDFFDLKIGDPVVLIGNNEGEEFSIKKGIVVNLTKNKGDRHSTTFQTSFDRTGGSSGSPVLNAKGEVVGLHFKGTDTSSFELAINYLKDKLQAIEGGIKPVRGEIGVKLDIIKLADCQEYFNLPPEAEKTLREENSGLESMVIVESLIPGLPAENLLQPGDLVFRIGDRIIGDNLYLFDKIVDQHQGGEAEVSVFRGGREIKPRIPVVDAEKLKITRFVTFAGGTFHDLSPAIRYNYDITGPGVYLSQAESGSSADSFGNFKRKNTDQKAVVIKSINGRKTENINDLELIAASVKNGDRATITYKDYLSGKPSEIQFMFISLHTSPSMVYSLNQETNDWIGRELN